MLTLLTQLPAGFRKSFRLGGTVALWDGVITYWVSWMRLRAKGVALHSKGSYSDILTTSSRAGCSTPV